MDGRLAVYFICNDILAYQNDKRLTMEGCAHWNPFADDNISNPKTATKQFRG